MDDGTIGDGAMNDGDFMRSVLQRIATGPTMSTDLPRQDARRAMRLVLEGRADEVQAGIFLIALRMKRESDEELAGVLEALREGVQERPLALDTLLCLADPYDGYVRGTPVSPFLPAVLAACGVPTLSHGVAAMGPKFGATHAQVLTAAGATLPDAVDEAGARLEDPSCGWAYLDQRTISAELAALEPLRTRIVKRPCLTTLEVALCPFRPRGTRHLLTGFVHKAYPPVYAMLARVGEFDGAVIVRGVEGGVVPSLAQASRAYASGPDGVPVEFALEPGALGIAQTERAVPLPALDAPIGSGVRPVGRPADDALARIATEAARTGLSALAGEPGAARDSLVYAGAVALHGLGRVDGLAAGAEVVRAALDDGRAAARFAAGCPEWPGRQSQPERASSL